jgi:NAD(P)-dependent dehydrogenase (short-subunit alcohol dehydrogenase family)
LFPNATITVYKLDLSSVASIKNFAGKIKFLFADGIDVLINNAGVFTKTRKILEMKSARMRKTAALSLAETPCWSCSKAGAE